MSIHKSSLSSSDIKFFYKILYQYEKEGGKGHKGYSIYNVPSEVRNKIKLLHDKKNNKVELKFPKEANVLLFKGTEVAVPLIMHLRHSFAHAHIEKAGDNYIINKELCPQCKICGKVNQKRLKNLMNELLATKH